DRVARYRSFSRAEPGMTWRGARPAWRRSRPGLLIQRVTLLQFVAQRLECRLAVMAGLSGRLDPACVQRLGGIAPGLVLLGGQLVDRVPALGLQLLLAGVFVVAPCCADLRGPLVVAVVVDDLLLRGPELVVPVLVHHPVEGRCIEPLVVVVLDDPVDTEGDDRLPR